MILKGVTGSSHGDKTVYIMELKRIIFESCGGCNGIVLMATSIHTNDYMVLFGVLCLMGIKYLSWFYIYFI